MNEQDMTLESWMAKATAGLPPSAVEKFRAEIADHAAEARQRHIAAGMAAGEADRAVLAALGDAAEVARTFRDAHFSRRVYKRGMASALFLMVVGSFALSLNSAVVTLGGTGLMGRVAGALPLWEVLMQAATGALLLVVTRGALTFLREQYDIRAGRWLWAAFVGAVALSAAPNVIGALAARSGGVDVDTASLVLTASQTGTLLMGALMLGFCITQLARPAGRANRLAALILALGALAGAELALTGGVYFAGFVVSTGYYAARLMAVMGPAVSIVPVVLYGPYMALIMTLVVVFARMRRPGAVVSW